MSKRLMVDILHVEPKTGVVMVQATVQTEHGIVLHTFEPWTLRKGESFAINGLEVPG